jgi:hypothetical protein
VRRAAGAAAIVSAGAALAYLVFKLLSRFGY